MRTISVGLITFAIVGCGSKYNQFSDDIIERNTHWTTPQPRSGELTEQERIWRGLLGSTLKITTKNQQG